MKTYLFIMVLILSVFTISLSATPFQDNTGENFLRISIINSQEEVIKSDLYTTDVYEILAIKPEEIVLVSPEGYNRIREKKNGAESKSSNWPGIKNGGVNRIKSGRH